MIRTGRLAVGSKATCRAFVRQRAEFYTYILWRPDGRPFYVGKGVGARAFSHENEARHADNRRSNPHKLNVIRAIVRSGLSVEYEIDFVSVDEKTVYAREEVLIRTYKRLHEGGCLTNLAPGGGSLRGSAPFSTERHSATLSGSPEDNPERAVLNAFVLNIGAMGSVVIKPVSQFVARRTQPNPSRLMKYSRRQAVALVASAAANGIFLDDACTIPRKMTLDDIEGLVENGVACDILTSGMADVISAANPADERFRLSAEQARRVVSLVGFRKCLDLGVSGSWTSAK